jgi:hypothetical protein
MQYATGSICTNSYRNDSFEDALCSYPIRAGEAAPERNRAADTAVGTVNQKVEPPPSFRVAHNFPPCASAIERLIVSPIPIPCSFVVKCGLNTVSTSGTAIPRPVSLTEIKM